MNSREKLLSVMGRDNKEYLKVQIPKIEYGYWALTIRKWFNEGLFQLEPIPEYIAYGNPVMAYKDIYSRSINSVYVNICKIFDLDYNLTKFPVNYSPMWEEELIEKTERHIFYKDSYGVVYKSSIQKTSIPLSIDYPVKDWESWEKYKEGYGARTIQKRLPLNWNDLKVELKNRDFPIRLGELSVVF